MIKNRQKIFFILIILGTIFGVFYGRLGSIKREKTLKKSEIIYTTYSDSINHTIIAIEKKRYSDGYIKAIKENQKTVDFPFLSLEKGKKLYILDKISEDLYKVALVTYPPSRTRSSYIECYIWTGFLQDNNGSD